MTTFITVLSQADMRVFEAPPIFSEEERSSFFEFLQWADDIIGNLRTPTNKAGFILQLGYFRATNKFFSPRDFHLSDIAFVARVLSIPQTMIFPNSYERSSYERHQDIILENLGFRKFDNKVKRILRQEAYALSRKLSVTSFNTFVFSLAKIRTTQELVPEGDI